MTPNELFELKEIFIMYQMRGGSKKREIKEEDGIRDFAFATVVATKEISIGEQFTIKYMAKRPGIGE